MKKQKNSSIYLAFGSEVAKLFDNMDEDREIANNITYQQQYSQIQQESLIRDRGQYIESLGRVTIDHMIMLNKSFLNQLKFVINDSDNVVVTGHSIRVILGGSSKLRTVEQKFPDILKDYDNVVNDLLQKW